jgi:hypothetical protein
LDRNRFSLPEPAQLEHGARARVRVAPSFKPDSEVDGSCSRILDIRPSYDGTK